MQVPRVLIIFQKKAWADITTMIEIATRFDKVKKDDLFDKHALIALDNLATHCATEVQHDHRQGKVLLCCFPKKAQSLLK